MVRFLARGGGAVALALVASCSGGPPAGAARPAVPVTVATVEKRDVPVQIDTFGNVEPWNSVSVKALVTGNLTGVHIQDGQALKPGDLVFSIDPRPFEAALKSTQANLARDAALARNAAIEKARAEKLFKDNVITPEALDAAAAAAEAAEAAVGADRAAVETARLQLEYCAIRSPIDGRAGSVLIKAGNAIKANDVPMVVINQVRPIYVNFAVPEQFLPQVRQFMAAGTLAVRAGLPGDGAPPEQGTLAFVDNAVDATTGMIRLKGSFANEQERLWPGQYVSVSLTITVQRGVAVIPAQAIQAGQQGPYLFVIRKDLTAELRPVTVGRPFNGQVIVEKGVEPGEQVVTDGQLRLVSGAKVEIMSSPDPQPPAAAPPK